MLFSRVVAFALAFGLSAGCGDDAAHTADAAAANGSGGAEDAGARGGEDAQKPVVTEQTCELADGAEEVEFLQRVGCLRDFDAVASVPLDANLPGARSAKVVLDRQDGNALYFQNSRQYQIHFEFASAHLSGDGRPVVLAKAEFDNTEYYKPDRRFLLGAVTYYESADEWVLEMAPYDTASPEMIVTLLDAVKAATYFGPALAFHPSSEAHEEIAAALPESVRVVTTDDLYAKIDYQPLTLGTAVGRLRFVKAADLATEYLSYQDIVVLDEVPNDISVVSGIITEEFQTPLSHINVLSQNRGTPNMGLRNATRNETLLALSGKLVELSAKATAWTVREVSEEEAQSFWDAHLPEPVELPPLDLDVHGLWDIEDLVTETGPELREAIKRSVLAFGGKAAQYSVLANTPDVPTRKAFAVPVFYYDQFMRDNGFYDRIAALLEDPTFQQDARERDLRLAELREDMASGSVDPAFQEELRQKLEQDYPGLSMRFRTSTNSEDLEGFPCAGCYESHTGYQENWETILDAIRETWASIWLFRTFEERNYYRIDHTSVGMALLVHHNFPDEEANGVAVTANPFDESGLEPAFYVNVQWGGEAEVVHPPPGITSDQFLYFFSSPNQPITFLAHSNLVNPGETVLTARQTFELGKALQAIHDRFSPAYGPASGNLGWYAMDVEFKFDDEGMDEPALYVKQARPYPGRDSKN